MRCKWFEESVLPLKIDLMQDYFDEKNIICNINSKIEIYRKRCKECNKQFTSEKENKQYCPECEEKIKKEKSRERSKNYRKNQKKNDV